jgi:hypothetical protein
MKARATRTLPTNFRTFNRRTVRVHSFEWLFLSDIVPTSSHAAVQCDIQPTDTLAIWAAALSAT